MEIDLPEVLIPYPNCKYSFGAKIHTFWGNWNSILFCFRYLKNMNFRAKTTLEDWNIWHFHSLFLNFEFSRQNSGLGQD